MAQQVINIGLVPNDGTGDALRVALDKTNTNFKELYEAGAATSVQPARSISAGTGLTGGGSLAADRTLALSTAALASLALADAAVQPEDIGTAALQDSTAFATSAQGGKADTAVQPARTISAGSGLTGGGSLAADRSIALDSAAIASLAKADSAVQDPETVATVAQLGMSPSNTAAANTTALNAILAAAAKAYDVPEGAYQTTKGQYDILNKRLAGPGQIILDGIKQAPQYVMITAPQPTHSDNRYQFFDAGFDLAHSASFTFIGNGANPTILPDIYTNYPEWNARVHIHDFTAGFNKDAADHALGRSGAFVDTLRMYHGGQGDLVGRNFFGSAYSTRVGATHWLATPALIVENGNLGADPGVGCVFLNHSEYIFSDNGNPISVIDRVRNYHRSNGGGELGQVWIHDRPQSSGPVSIEAFYAPQGFAKRGMDFGTSIFDASKAAIALKANDRIYFNAVSTPDGLGAQFYSQTLNQEFMYFDPAESRMKFAVGNVASLQVSAADVYAASPLLVKPGTNGATLFANGQITFALVDNTHIALKARGSDGVTRTGSVLLT